VTDTSFTGEDDGTRQVPQSQSQDLSILDRGRHKSIHIFDFAGAESFTQGSTIQLWTDSGFGDQESFRSSLRESPSTRVASERETQYQPNNDDRGKHDEGEGREQADLTVTDSLLYSLG
jgi:hypothetical protein